MKRLKKTFAPLWTLCLVLALAAPVRGASPYAITVNGAQTGETYNIYKMLDLTVDDPDAPTAYDYTVNAAWANFFGSSGAGAAYVTLDGDDGHVTWATGKDSASDMEAFGKAAAAFAVNQGIATAAADQTPASDSAITFSLADPGYYLITSTNGALAIVDTTPTDPTPSITEKNADPTLTKAIDGGEDGGKVSCAQIGDTVNFTATISAKKGGKNYVYHDALGGGFTLDPDAIAVTGLTKGSDYTVVTSGLTDGCSFEIQFAQAYLDAIADTDIVITYAAKLSDDAVVGSGGNKNTARLTWGDAGETVDAVTTTYTFAASVYKYTMKEAVETALAGAKFTLSKQADGADAIKFIQNGTAYKVAADQTSAAAVGEIETDTTGKFTLEGLDAGTYYLAETAAPKGYNKLAGPVKVVVTAATDGAATVTYYDYDDAGGGYAAAATGAGEIKVLNNTGVELPSTGGMGTTLFYVIGGVLAAGAILLLAVKKRTGEED